MRLLLVAVGVTLAVGLASCGGTKTVVKTVTVVQTVTAGNSASPLPPRAQRPMKPPASAHQPPSGYIRCDPNIEAKAGTTTCGFAENAFWEYWTNHESSSISVWSPATHSSFNATCTPTGSMVVCKTATHSVVRFTQAAVDSYSSAQADAYARSHDVGPHPDSHQPSAPKASPTTRAPPRGPNIPNYPNRRGYRVQCRDGTYSRSGGIQGACSHHGGVQP